MMHWIQDENGASRLDQLQLDIVGFLAILGEGSVLANAQVSTLSKWVFLPRLIPAPQSLMKPTRPDKLEPVPGRVTGIFSMNDRDNINHIGNIVCDASSLPIHCVRVVNITRVSENSIKAKALSPLTAVCWLGCVLSIILLSLAIWLKDGMSIVATVLLSLLSSLIGWGNYWKLRLPDRKLKNGKVPDGDVVIRYDKGSFLVIRCEEDVARELYFAPESIDYWLKYGPAYRILSLVGTMMLMGGVICLANALIQLQVAWAGSYMLLGASYWIVAALPSKANWDYSCYSVENEALTDSAMDRKGYPSVNDTYTKALWKAIVVTKSTEWVLMNNACPDTAAWRRWLEQAKKEAKKAGFAATTDKTVKVTTWEVPEWDPQQYLIECLKLAADELNGEVLHPPKQESV
ncbi:hypothetical protein P154DRAFT_492929 [Amniculicola lignicola CBS 123094]|uniref:Uncharacterized protein n=1 Tax=Amniculicola lignicola CBS 123094 TaxID=1392246 RepID=A0A6A5WGM6_9PLEO|nr:hypothetical protein P154DRAFT_492929 [Amniculicola lignicola CBS 123094]